MKIVIFGLSKSGTTAIFSQIKDSLPPNSVCLFEPQAFDASIKTGGRTQAALRRVFQQREPHILAKVLPFTPTRYVNAESFSLFEKQIFIVRDPRDRIISQLLYGIWNSNFYHQDEKVSAFIELLRRKEAEPASVTLKTALKTFIELRGESFVASKWASDYRNFSIGQPLSLHDKRPQLFLFKYENMIDRRFDDLGEYLNVELKGEAAVAPDLQRVTRTKGYDGWRDWLTPEDVDFLRPILSPFLDRYYPYANWELNRSPAISAKHTSMYVERIVNDKRVLMNKPLYNRSQTQH